MPMLILTKDLTASIISLMSDHPHIIAICDHPDGSACHVDGHVYVVDEPTWKLDNFLTAFLE